MLMFSHTVASGSGGTSLVPLVASDGHLQVDVLSTPADDAIYVDDADWSDGASKHMLVGGLYQSSPQSITDGDVGPLQVNANGNLIIDVVNGGVLESAVDGIETLLTGIDSDTDAIKTSVESLDNAVDGNYLNVNANIAGTDFVGGAGAVASGVQRVTLASDDPGVAHLGNMFYDTALAVTPSDGSDLSGEPYYAVWVGTGGDLKVDMADGGSAVTLSNCASGQLIPIMVERIYSTGTTASNIIAFK